MISKGHYINGLWTTSAGEPLTSHNPATGDVLWHGTKACAQEIAAAMQAAGQAQAVWSTSSFEQRLACVLRFGEHAEKNQEALALLISQESGKPLWESRTETTAVIDKINLSVQAYRERTWPKQTVAANGRAMLRYKPQGIAVVLGPFNFPAHLSNGHIVPALLAGNTIIYKPSEHTPAVAEFIMQCWHASQLPPGVINCLQGDAHTARMLLQEKIQAVYFTGSYPTGLHIHQQFAQRPEVVLALEMGGNNPLVLDKVSDLNSALYQTVLSTFITAGQRCSCARRLMVPKTAQGDDFVKQFVSLSKAIQIAAYDTTPQPFMGPVISEAAAQQHLQAQAHLLALGATPLLTMQALQANTGFLSPGILDMTGITDAPDEEIFAPCVQLYRYQTFEEAIQLAKNTRYGLVAALFSDNETQYHRFYEALACGLINWNRPTTGAMSSLPFGGVGCSGNHRPSAYFASDYCAYPIASMEIPQVTTPAELLPGIPKEALA